MRHPGRAARSRDGAGSRGSLAPALIAACAASAFAANAQDAAAPTAATPPATAPSTPAQLDPVVVTATRSAESAFEVPASIDAVAAAEIEAAVPGVNLSEVLRGVAGVLVRDRQNFAQDQQISIRGFGTRAPFGIVGSRLYVDGIPATMPDGAGQVSHVNLNSASRVEVLRGPYSALYGNAAGGVIQVFSGRGADAPGLEAEFAAGGFDAWRTSAAARGASGALDYALDYTHVDSGGYRDHSQARRDSVNARLGFDLGGGALTLVANHLSLPLAQDPLGLTRTDFEADPRQAVATAEQFDTRKTVEQSQLGLGLDLPFGDAHALRATLHYGARDVEQYLATPPVAQANPLHSGGVVDLDNTYWGLDANWRWRTQLGGGDFTLVAGLAHDLQDSARRGYENFTGPAGAETLGVRGALRRDEDNRITDFDQYLQAQWTFDPRWTALAGVRRNTVDFRLRDQFVTPANPDDSGTLDFDDVTPVAGLLFRAAPRLRLYGSYGEGFDSPTFAELSYPPAGQSGPNRDLQAARTRSGELGLKWRFGQGGALDAALFQADTRDEVVVATASGGRSSFQNAGRTRRRGLELSLSAPLAGALRGELAATVLDASFREPFETCSGRVCPAPNTPVPAGRRVPGVPKLNASGALRWGGATGWQAALEAGYLSRVAVNSPNSEFAPAYALLAISGSYTWDLPQWRVRAYARLDNALDRDHAGSVIVGDANGQFYEPGPGRNAFAGIELRWRH